MLASRTPCELTDHHKRTVTTIVSQKGFSTTASPSPCDVKDVTTVPVCLHAKAVLLWTAGCALQIAGAELSHFGP